MKPSVCIAIIFIFFVQVHNVEGDTMGNIEDEMKEFLEENTETEIHSKKFRDTRTGEIVTQFLLTDIKYMEEIL